MRRRGARSTAGKGGAPCAAVVALGALLGGTAARAAPPDAGPDAARAADAQKTDAQKAAGSGTAPAADAPAGTTPEAAAPKPDPSAAPAAAAPDPDKPPRESGEQDGGESRPRVRVDAVNIVSYTRQTVFDAARAASAVERDELRSRPPRSSGDALLDEEGVFVQRPNYSTALPSMRGLGTGHVLVLVDGVRLNNTLTSTLSGGFSNINLVDPYTVDAIEIVRGPGLAAYGTDGLGGAIQLRTRRPAPIAGSNIELNGGARGIYSSYDQSFQGSVSGGGRWSRYALDVAFSARRFSDLTAGTASGGAQPFTNYSEGGLYVGAGADLGTGTLVIVYQGVRQYDGLRSERTTPSDLFVVSEVARDLVYMRYDGSFEARSHTVDVTATVSFQRQGEEASRQRLYTDQLDRAVNRNKVVGVQASARVDLGRGGRLSTGLDGYFEFVTSSAQRGTVSGGSGGASTAAPEQQRYPDDSRAQSFAVFLQDEIDLEKLARGDRASSAHAGRLKLLAAARVGANALTIGRDERLLRLLPQLMQPAQEARTLLDPVYAGSLHLRYEFYPGLAAFAGFLTSARVPNLDDYARLDAGRPGLLVPVSGRLRREAAYSAETGLRAATRYLEGAATYSYTYLDSPLALGELSVAGQPCVLGTDGRCADRFLQRANADFAQLHTIEAMVRARLLWGLSAWATIQYTHGEAVRPGSPGAATQITEPMWRVPPLYGVAALQLRRPRSVWSFAEVALRWAAPQNRLAAQDRLDPTVCAASLQTCNGTPGYLIVSLRSSLRLARQMYLSGTIENITNEGYRLHGSGISSAGLGANIGLEANY